MIGAPATTPATIPGLTPAKPPSPRPAESASRPAVAPPPLREDEQVPVPAEVTFGEFLSALNPLHHIPVVGWIYRQMTGETIQPVFRVLGGLVTGGPIGAIASAVATLAEELLGGADTGTGTGDSGTALAQAPAPPTTPPTTSGATPGTAPAIAAAAAVPAAVQAATAQPAAVQAAATPAPGSLAAIITASGQPLQPLSLPLASRLAARAYPAAALPLREAAPPPDPLTGFVPAAAALPGAAVPSRPASLTMPERAATNPHAAAADAAMAEQPAPAPGPAARIRRAPVVPVSSGGQDPAFMQQMMRGLEAYERSMRARTAPQPVPAAAAP